MRNEIKIKNITKSFDTGEIKIDVLKGVGFEIDHGEIAVMLGPSGSGKTTLLNIIGGLETFDQGEISFGDHKIDLLTDEQLVKFRKDNLGFVFQSYNLINDLTVYENVKIIAEISDNPLDVDHILDEVGLLDARNKYPNQLSGGMQQRVSIARALVKKPKLLICDEPTGALDEDTGKDVLALLQKLNKEEDITILIVTHNAHIKKIANRVINLKNGLVEKITHNKTTIDARKLDFN